MAKSKPKKSKPKQTAAQKNLSSWTKTVNKYGGGWTNSKDYKALMKSKEKKDMDASVKGYNSLLNGGYGGYAKANGLTDYTARLQNMLGSILSQSFLMPQTMTLHTRPIRHSTRRRAVMICWTLWARWRQQQVAMHPLRRLRRVMLPTRHS